MTQTQGNTFSTNQMLVMLSALDSLGVSSSKVLGRLGLARDRIELPHARLPVELDEAIWDAVIEESGDPAIALRVAKQFAPGAFGSFEYVIRNCASIEEQLVRANEFMRLLDDSVRVEMIAEADRLGLRLRRDHDLHPLRGASVECVFAVLYTFGTEMNLPAGLLREVRFQHRARAPVAVYERFFGCEVSFGAAHNELLAHASVVEVSHKVDAHLRRLVEEHARHQLSQVPEIDPFLHAVRSRLLSQLRGGPPNLACLARSLHMSERTLRRRLQTVGTRYQDLLDELRAQLAVEYVLQPDQTMKTLAQRLGFSEPSTFYRAFKRWTGATPAQFQKRAREASLQGTRA